MSILLLLVPLSLMLVGIAAWAFAWAVRRGQFDDLDTPALYILGDDHRDADPRRGPGGSDADGGSGGAGGGHIPGGEQRDADPVRGHRGSAEGADGNAGGYDAD